MTDKTPLALPQLRLTPEAFAKILLYVRNCSVEISGFAKVERQDDGTIVVSEPFILPQRCSLTLTEPLREALVEFLEGFLLRPEVKPEEYVCWWHSHIDGPALFSMTDVGTIERSFRFADFWVSLVANTYGEIFGRIDVYGPQRCYAAYSHLAPAKEDIAEVRRLMERGREAVRAEIAEKVRIAYDEEAPPCER